jgi:hypothetical protein
LQQHPYEGQKEGEYTAFIAFIAFQDLARLKDITDTPSSIERCNPWL